MTFARSQVVLWKFLYQNQSNIYTNIHRNGFSFLHCDWLNIILLYIIMSLFRFKITTVR